MTVKSKLNVAMEFGDMEHRAYGVAHAFGLIHLLHNSDADTCDIAECLVELIAALGFETGDDLFSFILGITPELSASKAKAA